MFSQTFDAFAWFLADDTCFQGWFVFSFVCTASFSMGWPIKWIEQSLIWLNGCSVRRSMIHKSFTSTLNFFIPFDGGFPPKTVLRFWNPSASKGIRNWWTRKTITPMAILWWRESNGRCSNVWITAMRQCWIWFLTCGFTCKDDSILIGDGGAWQNPNKPVGEGVSQ